ncbi:hypothetical protein HD554DRAFT_2172098 [Boletus coccyginus]|nr:hypothetical protein HD554DRAFT_2172098 [Boletus coccyginus]
MPPKRRGALAKSATKPPPPPPEPPKLPSPPKSVPTPPAPAPPPPPQPVETDAAKVRKEWYKFIDAWYEPHRKKLVEKLQKDILVKYKDLGPPKDTQKLREMELFEKLDSIAKQLTEPARAEWERRLALAQLREDQWNDMSAEEQQAVMGVFVGFFAEDMDDLSAEPPSVEEEESIVEEPPKLSNSSTQHSFFAESMTPPNPTKNLPALSMDHLATLGPSNAGRSAEPVSANVNGVLGFQNWASEAGIVTQLPQAQSAKPPPASVPAQSLSARPRAMDMSRQASAASSSSSSPPLKTSSPQYSPPIPTTKFSPPINAENLPLGKRYIGPVLEEELDPLDEELLKSKMADEYQQYKVSLRIQMIYQFHAEAAEVEIKLFETLLADQGTKESRARAVQVHESSMMRLREQKEEERKRLCAEEREKRRQEVRQHLAQRRSPQNREVDPGAKANPPKPSPDKALAQQRPGKGTHQKENIPLPQPATASSSSKLELPSSVKRSNSSLSQGEASANEALFASAMAQMTQGKAGATGLTPAQASSNEALFSNAAAVLATQNQPGSSGKSTVQPPSIMKKSNSSRSQDQDIPQITVSFAEPLTVTPEPAQAPPATIKGKKGKKGQPTAQLPPAKTVAITEEPEMEMDAEPPPALSPWDTATVAAKNIWSVASTSNPTSKGRLNVPVEEERGPDPIPTTAPAPSKGNVNAKKTVLSAKKGKTVTITEEPDVDADPIVSPPPSVKTKATKGAWGSVNGKSKVTPSVEESELEHSISPPPVTSARGKKAAEAAAKSALKPQLKTKSAWEVPAATSSASASMQAGNKSTQQQADLRRGAATSGSKDGQHDAWCFGVCGIGRGRSKRRKKEEGDATAWLNPEDLSYWANLAGQSEVETQTVPQATEQTGKHVRWTPTTGGESEDEDEFGEADDELAASMWMQFAISGGDMPALGGAPEEPRAVPSEIVQETSLWEQGRGKKKLNPTTGDFGSRVQQTSVFDRAALTGQWPKMESWLSPPSRGQSSGSARVF